MKNLNSELKTLQEMFVNKIINKEFEVIDRSIELDGYYKLNISIDGVGFHLGIPESMRFIVEYQNDIKLFTKLESEPEIAENIVKDVFKGFKKSMIEDKIKELTEKLNNEEL